MADSSLKNQTIPFFDLGPQHADLAEELKTAVERVLASQIFILGPEVQAFEREIANYCGTRHAIGVSSGTDALLCALLATEIGAGDEVITTPYTFFSSVEAILRVGARPVFVDIDPRTFNIDTDQIEACITSRTRAILPVHLFGQTADMSAIERLAQRHQLLVIEDAAQAIGAKYGTKRAGNLGNIGCFSCFPTKNLGALGDAGFVTTHDDTLAERVRRLRNHGFSKKHHSGELGGNFRMDALQAAVLRAKLPHLETWTARRRDNARKYREALAPIEKQNSSLLSLPHETEGTHHVYNQFVIRSTRRDELRTRLSEHRIGSEVYYPLPAHLQKTCAPLGHSVGDFPEAERAALEALALPIYPELPPAHLSIVGHVLQQFANVAQ